VPVRLRVVVGVQGASLVRADHVHAVLTTWLEDEHGHHAAAKGFHLSPWRTVDGATGVIDVAVADDALIPPIIAGLAANSSNAGSWCDDVLAQVSAIDSLFSIEIEAGVVAHDRRFRAGPGASLQLGGRGNQARAVVASVGVIRAQRWDELASVDEPALAFELHCASPTHFRSGSRPLLEPVATQIFGSWRRAWRLGLPEGEPQVDFRGVGLCTVGVDGDVELYRAHGRTVEGFVGRAWVQAPDASASDEVALGRLAALAPYVNVGSNAVVGMGVVVPRWQR
jgi:hypothetical protein